MERDNVVTRGWGQLFSGSFLRKWKRRYFIVSRNELSFYKSDHASPAAVVGTISLTNCACGRSSEMASQNRPFCLKLTANEKAFYIAFETSEELDVFLSAVKKSIRISNENVDQTTEKRSSSAPALRKSSNASKNVSSFDSKASEHAKKAAASAEAAGLKASQTLCGRRDSIAQQSRAYRTQSLIRNTSFSDLNVLESKNARIAAESARIKLQFPGSAVATSDRAWGDTPVAIADDDAFELAIGCAQVFSKRPEHRNKEEQVYVLALRNFAAQVKRLCKEAVPDGRGEVVLELATGTYAFAVPFEQRTEAEREYVMEIELQLAALVQEQRLLIRQQEQFLIESMRVFVKAPEERTADEIHYVASLTSTAENITQMEREAKSPVEFSLIGGSIVFAKPPASRTVEDISFLAEVVTLLPTQDRLIFLERIGVLRFAN
eukprot:ANDGO_04409.mRNA.1 hypothetical protein